MYENGKMRPVEAFLGMGEERIKNEGRGMIYFKNICKCHNVSPVQQQ
jgi:hypothetical protein